MQEREREREREGEKALGHSREELKGDGEGRERGGIFVHGQFLKSIGGC